MARRMMNGVTTFAIAVGLGFGVIAVGAAVIASAYV